MRRASLLVVLALILLFNEMARPYMEQAQIVPVDYSTFMQSIDDKTVDHVEIQSNQILYTVKDDHKKYKTGIMNDPTLAQRLIELRKDNWELAAYPLERHGFARSDSWLDEYKRVLKLFDETLKPAP